MLLVIRLLFLVYKVVKIGEDVLQSHRHACRCLLTVCLCLDVLAYFVLACVESDTDCQIHSLEFPAKSMQVSLDTSGGKTMDGLEQKLGSVWN